MTSMTTTAVKPTTTSADKARPIRRRRPSDFACKQVMAVTGIAFGLFVLMHMIGNLKAYLGPPLVPYSGVLWALRVVLLACVVGHVGCAWRQGKAHR